MEATKTNFSSSALLPVITSEKNNNGAEFTVVSKATNSMKGSILTCMLKHNI